MSVYLGDKKILKICSDFNGSVQTQTTKITPTKSVQIKTPPDGKYFNQVTVEAIPDSYIQPEGTLEVSSNGVYDVTNKSLVSVGVAESGGAALDIEYSQTPPSDTGKFWIKSEEPSTLKIDYAADDYDIMSFNEFLVVAGKKFNYTVPMAAVGNYIYVFGDLLKPTKGVTKINILTKTYETLDIDLFDGMEGASVGVLYTTIYICGGNGKVYAFNTLSDTLTYVTTINVPKNAMCVAYNDYLYFAGGTASGKTDAVNSFRRYKPSTNEFTGLSVLYEPIKRPLFMEHGGYFYLFGGLTNDGYTDNIYRYDFNTERWSVLNTKLPKKICGLHCIKQGETAYLLMGQYSNTEIWKYDFTTQTIVKSDKVTRYNYNVSAVQIGNDFYCIGAYDESSGFMDKVYKMTMKIGLETDTVLLLQGEYGKKIKLASGNKELFVKVRKVYKGNASGEAVYQDAFYHNGTEWININTNQAYSAG